MAADTELRCLTCKVHITGRNFSGPDVINQFLREHTMHELEAWSEYSPIDDIDRWENDGSIDVTEVIAADLKSINSEYGDD